MSMRWWPCATPQKCPVAAHRAALAATSPGKREADAAAAYGAVITAEQCRLAFNPIITIRIEVLHGHGHSNIMPDGAMLLGGRRRRGAGGYACDISRTWPVSGKWSPIQRHLYDVTLRAMREATAACVPGARYRDVHDLAGRIICEGLLPPNC